MTRWGVSARLTSPRAVLQRPSMETLRHQSDTRAYTSLMDTLAPSATAFVAKVPIRTVRTVRPLEAFDMGRNRPPLPSALAGLKPMRDETRRMLPFGSPKGEGRHYQASKRSTGGVASSQVDPPQGGTGVGAQLHGRWRDRSPLRLPECMDGPASPVSVPPPAALREVRLNGFRGALAEVFRHRVGGGGCRVSDAALKGLSDTAYVGQPAYPLSYNGAGEGWPPPPLRSPRSSRSRGGRGRGLRPPSPVPVRRDA